jgi:rubrerythrin
MTDDLPAHKPPPRPRRPMSAKAARRAFIKAHNRRMRARALKQRRDRGRRLGSWYCHNCAVEVYITKWSRRCPHCGKLETDEA